jgi:heme exporter protein A
VPALRATRLACRRGGRLLFKELDFDVAAGSIVWVRGQNGRGKTSLLRLAAGLSRPEQGQLLWNGVPVAGAPQYVSQLVYIGHTSALKDDLSAGEALDFLLRLHGRAAGVSVTDAALERMGLRARAAMPIRTMSQGQKRRVALARLAVPQGPGLWILDEPFDALDTDGVARLNGLLSAHVAGGGQVLLTSHQSLNHELLQPQVVDLDRYC